MAYGLEFGEWVKNHLSGLGPIEIKRMFAILDDGVIWLKADAALAEALQAEGARQFTYPTKDGQTMAMAYWSMPETALDDPDKAVNWARRSVEAALKPKPAKRRKTPS